MQTNPHQKRAALALARAAGLLLLALPLRQALAQGFAAYVSPPRFELQLKAGETSRQILEIQQASEQRGHYRVYTNDWTFSADQSIVFSDELAADSCRPWVAIERREVSVDADARYRYRFEITPPADSPPRECRFALMIQGRDAAQVKGAMNIPVGGRIAVIVYGAVGGATPELSLVGTRVLRSGGVDVPVLDVRNTGMAHGRLEGFVNAVDASGKRFEMAPSNLPILPGETRSVAILPVTEEGKPKPETKFPLTIRGNLEWGKNQMAVEARFPP